MNLEKVLEKNLMEVADGVIIDVIVKPQSNEEKLVVEDDSIVFYTAEPPVKGRANASLIRYLVRNLRVPITNIEIVWGKRVSRKRVLVKDFSKEELLKRLAEALKKLS